MKNILLIVLLLINITILTAEEALFSVTNDATPPDTVFAVYPSGIKVMGEDGELVMIANRDSVRMYIDEDAAGRASRGGFAIGGVASRDFTKSYLAVQPDSTRIYFNELEGRASRGGFAVGGVASRNRNLISDYFSINPDSTRINVKDSDEGFSVGNIQGQGANKFLDLTSDNYFIGHESGRHNTDGYSNLFLGKQSGYYNTTGHNNTFIGEQTGFHNTGGFYNVYIGYRSGYKSAQNPSPPYNGPFRNVYLGANSGYEGVGSTSTVLIGYSAGRYLAEGTANTVMGSEAGQGGPLGTNEFADYSCNSFFGSSAGKLSTSGYNSFFGTFSGYSNVTGAHNCYFGNNTGFSVTDGFMNSFFGSGAGQNKTTGNYNTILGYGSGQSNGTGEKNTFIGAESGMYNTNGDTNVFVGYRAGKDETGSNKLYIENSDSSDPLIYGDFSSDYVKINDVLQLNPRSSAPSNPQEGMIYYNSNSHKLLVFDGSSWQELW